MSRRFFHANVRCEYCHRKWPQVLNKPLQEIECYQCGQRGVSVTFDTEGDLIRWQTENPGFPEAYALMEEEYYNHQAEMALEADSISADDEWFLFENIEDFGNLLPPKPKRKRGKKKDRGEEESLFG